jgi:biopolymer transport protein ExbD
VQQSIQVQLPKAATGENTPKVKNLAFVLDKSGAMFLDGKPITLEDIAARVQAEKSADPNVQLQALVAADKETPHGFVVSLIDAVRRQGITDLAINVEKSGL